METEQLAQSHLHQVARVHGKSMMPLLENGDQVVLEVGFDRNKLAIGQIIAVGKSSENLALHRLVAKTPELVLTKGDHTVFFDKPFQFSEIYGVAVLSANHQGELFNLFPASVGTVRKIFRGYLVGMLLYSRFRLSRLPQAVLRILGFSEKKQSNRVNMRYEVQKLGNDTVIYDHTTGDLHSLNETAALIWTSLNAGKSVEDIAEIMTNAYEGLTTEVALVDVDTLICELKSKELLSE